MAIDLSRRKLTADDVVFLNHGAGQRPVWSSAACASARFMPLPSIAYRLARVAVGDGIATVTLRPVRLISPPAPVDPRRFGISTTAVHDNIAAYRFTVPYVHDPRQKSLVYAVTVVARATWSDRHGTVIARTTTQLQLWLKVRGSNGPISATN